MLSLETLRCLASEVGFDDCGVVSADCLADDALFMDQWIQQGLHGNMTYLERNRSLRYDPRQLVPGAQSIVVGVLTYAHSGHDYHRAIKSKLYELEARLGTPPTEGQNKFCDSAPFLERRWAQRAGLGILGKNHQLIHPRLGSYIHLGELVLTEYIPPTASIVPDDLACGDCRRCIDACPGKALGQPQWDARRCVAYVTHKCTICQQVCPMNQCVIKN